MRNSRPMLCLVAFLLASGVLAGQKHSIGNSDDAETAAIHNCRLSMDKLERAAAAGDEILKLCNSDPKLADEIDKAFFNDNSSLDEQARRMEPKFPQIATILRAHGFSTREFLILRTALLLDLYQVESEKEDGAPAEPEAVLPANVKFIKNNLERVRALGRRIFLGQDK